MRGHSLPWLAAVMLLCLATCKFAAAAASKREFTIQSHTVVCSVSVFSPARMHMSPEPYAGCCAVCIRTWQLILIISLHNYGSCGQ